VILRRAGLKLGHPSSIVAECEELNAETYPGWAKVTFEFPARGSTSLAAGEHLPPVKLIWYEGHKDGNLVLPPKKLIAEAVAEHNQILLARDDKRIRGGKKVELSGRGSLIIGDKGTIYSPTDDAHGVHSARQHCDPSRRHEARMGWPGDEIPQYAAGGEVVEAALSRAVDALSTHPLSLGKGPLCCGKFLLPLPRTQERGLGEGR
jgi:hypothetical protein